MFEERKEFQKIGVAFVELAVVFLVATLVSMIPDANLTQGGVFFLSLLHIVAFYVSDYYYHFMKRGYLEELIQTIKYSIFYLFIASFVSFMLEDHFIISRRGMVFFILINAVAIYFMNVIVKYYRFSIYPQFKNSKKIVLITIGKRLKDILVQTGQGAALGGELVAVSILDCSEDEYQGVKHIKLEDLIDYSTHHVVDEVFINLPSEDYDISEMISQFEHMGITVSVNINALDFPSLGEKKVQELAGFSVVTFSTNFYNYSHVLAKRVLDIIGSIFGLLGCVLVGIILVPLIKKDGGPAIFAQDRVGKNGRIFKFYKFRSMYIDAEERKKDLMMHNTMQGGMFKMDNDPRITPIGRFIRKTSLDELPQFYNVLKGDMSLVGTRPPTVDEYNQYTPAQKRRLSFKPGITGLWQVSGRSQITNFEDVVKLDVAYIDDWTIWSDIKILLKTVKVVFTKDGAK